MMLKAMASTLCAQLCGTIKTELSSQEFGWLVRSRNHLSLLAQRRNQVIISRARLFAALFAVLTPAWILVDVLAFPAEIWRALAVARVVATLAFSAIVFGLRRQSSTADVYKVLGSLIAIPAAFFLFTHGYIARFHLQGVQAAFEMGYAFLPFVMVAGLSIFPLTIQESVAFAAPTILVQFLAAAILWPDVNWPTIAGIMWLLLLIAAVSLLAGLSQLAFMIVLVRDAIRDRMTGCFSRGSGEELLDLQFILASRIRAPLSVAFIDVDHFKRINDRFGHEAGDQVLSQATAQMHNTLRTGDMLIRWGGEEFVLIMPNINSEQAYRAMERLRAGGFGFAPDGVPITVSIGVADRLDGSTETWKDLVERADTSMYEAKQAGRDRIVRCRECDGATSQCAA